MPASGTFAPVLCRTWPRRGSDEVVGEKPWKLVIQVSVTSAVGLPFEEVTIWVLLSEPRLFAMTAVAVRGGPPVLAEEFGQQRNQKMSGANTFTFTLRVPLCLDGGAS